MRKALVGSMALIGAGLLLAILGVWWHKALNTEYSLTVEEVLAGEPSGWLTLGPTNKRVVVEGLALRSKAFPLTVRRSTRRQQTTAERIYFPLRMPHDNRAVLVSLPRDRFDDRILLYDTADQRMVFRGVLGLTLRTRDGRTIEQLFEGVTFPSKRCLVVGEQGGRREPKWLAVCGLAMVLAGIALLAVNGMNDETRGGPRRLILASSSPQRRDLLREADYEFEVIEPGAAESAARGDPRELAERLAYFKAREVADRLDAGLVLGADTIVALGEQVLGKPASAEEAGPILRTLAGTRHQVITGVCVIDAASGLRLVGSETTWVRMRPMSDREIDDYVASGAGLGKAGAYAVQAQHDPYVEEIDGSVSNVIGLPMELVARMLRVAERLS